MTVVRDDTVARDTVGVRVRTCTPRDLSSLANFVSDEEEEEGVEPVKEEGGRC